MASKKKEWIISGLMSGTSLDGLDIANCYFKNTNKGWHYKIVDATTIKYSVPFKNKLAKLLSASAVELAELDCQFGEYSGNQVLKFNKDKPYKIDAVASHGHTIFHNPSKGYTTQIGNGAFIHAACQIPVVSDFRTLDVALGGQGAPLVPIGDKLLFGNYTYCLNLGGIANISYDSAKNRIAGDVCPVNLVLNKLAEEKGKAYDKSGKFASNGVVDKLLYTKLNSNPFYKENFPKSLGREWIEKNVYPILDNSNLSVEDKLATYCEHIAFQLTSLLKKSNLKGELFITGGGAFNSYLVERIASLAPKNTTVVVPDPAIVAYKEALLFAFLGLKRILGEENALRSVTGASKNSIGGALYGIIK